ncbi:hypothetical protein DTO271D3_7889 [Paecilomyces variotii]|nr:hypothetical protein DTO271D3_7889 [Paecilomyces variotii]
MLYIVANGDTAPPFAKKRHVETISISKLAVNALPVWDQLARGRRLKSPLHHRCDTYQTPEAPPWVLSVKAGAGVYMPQLRSHIAN